MIGKTISHYQILEKLGEGGMGVVYKAKDLKLERLIAIKFLPHHISANSEEQQRFKIEAKAAAAFNHPNIATIHSIEVTDEDMFIVMEFIEGIELKKKINAGSIQIDEVINIATQIAEGLDAAHKKGIVHRDIKSSNIMLTQEGKVKIMDFGLAKIKGGTEVTNIGSTLGTAAYMSPEQAGGKQIDQRTDIWSFGVVLYEMLTKGLPFKGEYEQAVIYLLINEEPQPIDQYNSLVPDYLRQVVMLCLQKSREDRYSSFEEVLSDLRLREKKPSKNSDNRDSIEFIEHQESPENIFVGRESHLEFLHKKFRSIKETRESTVFICGESGIGKSQLVAKAQEEITALGINIIRGNCLYKEGGLPYHAFVSGIKSSIHNVNDHFVEMLLKHSVKHGINISGRIPHIKSLLNLSNESVTLLHKEQLWDSVLMLFQVLACEQPLILILDNLQWADRTTLDLFSYISRNIANLPILLLGMYRRDVALSDGLVDEASLAETVKQLETEGISYNIDLTRLTEEETSDFVSQLLGRQKVDRRLAEKIFKHTEGLPLFISELVNLLKAKQLIILRGNIWELKEDQQLSLVSNKIHDVIYQRISGLNKELSEILEIASCEGEYFLSETLASCLDIKRITLLKQLQILETKYGLIRHEGKRYLFDHLMIREVFYGSILPELREEYHRMISLYLIEKHSAEDGYASRIAHHLTSSNQEEESLDYLLRAANLARDLHANEEALNSYLKINKIIQQKGIMNSSLQIEVEEGLGDVNNSVGNSKDALNNFSNYLILARRQSSPVGEIKALRKSAEVHRTIGEVERALALCSEAIDKSKAIKNIEELINCINTLAFINAAKGEYDKTIENSEIALALAQEIKDTRNESICFSNMGFAYWHMGNYPSAMKYFNDAINIQRSIGDNLGLSTTLNFNAMAYWKVGEYNKGLDDATESVKIKKGIADYRKIPGSLNVIGDIYRETNNIEKAIEFHSQSLAMAKEHQNKGAMCDNIRDLGEDYMLLGNYESAMSKFNEVVDLSKSSGIVWYEVRSYISLSELYLLTGDEYKAMQYADKGFQNAKKLNAKDLIIEAMWTRANVLAIKKSYDKSEKLFVESIKAAEDVGHKTYLWKLYFDYSKLLEKQDRRDEAKSALIKSKSILQFIVNSFNNLELKESFLKSRAVILVLG